MDAHDSAGMHLPATDAMALDRLRRFGGDRLLGQMIDLFLVAAPERIEAASRARESGDAEGAERALHSLKSSSAQLGALRMQRLSEQGEQRARAGLLDEVAPVASALTEELARVRGWLLDAREQGAA